MKIPLSRFFLILTSSMVLLGANQSSGEIVIFNFVGQVTSVYNPLGLVDPALIHPGSPVQASIQYDTATPDLELYAADPTRGAFIGPGAVKVSINGFKFEQNNTIQVDILHGANGGQELFQAAGRYSPTAWPSQLPLFTYPEISMFFWETAAPYDLLSDAELHTSMDFSRADQILAFVRSGTSSMNAYEIQFNLLQQVPEPTAAGLLTIGLLCLAAPFSKKAKYAVR